MEHTPLPEDVIYVPSVEALEVLPDAVAVREKRIWRAADSDWVL